MKRIALLLLLFLFPPTFGYDNPSYGFSLVTPVGWAQSEDGYVLAVFTAPGTGTYEPRISINVLDRTRSGLDAVIDQIQQTYASIFTDFKVEEEYSGSILDLPSRTMVCTWKQGTYELRMEEIVVQKLNRYYDFGFIARSEDYDASLGVFRECMDTLSVFDPVHEDDGLGASLLYPSGWALDDVTFEDMTIFYGPEVSGFITNVVFATEAWDGDTADFVEDQKVQMEELLTGYQLLEEGTTALPAGTSRDLVYLYEIPGPTLIRARASMLCRDGLAYAMVYTSLPEAYDDSFSEYQGMLSSFRLPEAHLPSAFLYLFLFLAIFTLREL